MIFRDIVERFDIKQSSILKYFCKRVISNSAKEFSVNKVFNELKSQGYKISKDTLYNFQSYIESIYLSLFLQKYSYSFLKSELAIKKAYCIDTGLAFSLDINFSQNKGNLLENLVFLELLKAGKKIVYYANNFECDFLVLDKDSVIDAIQVCIDLNNSSTRIKEINSLVHACKALNLKNGKVITMSEEEEILKDGITINIIPAYKYVLAL